MSKRGLYSKLRFCPYCGVESLQRDNYRIHKSCPKAEFLCLTCGFGFQIGESARVALAAAIHADNRKRGDTKFTTASVGEDIAAKFLEELEKCKSFIK